MGNLPYILFRPKSETKEYIVLLFWFTNMDDAACEVQKTWKSLNEKYQWINSSCAVWWKTYQLQDVNSSIYLTTTSKVQKDDVCHLPSDNHEQLETFVKHLTNPEPMKKRKVDIIASTPLYYFINKRYVYNQCCDTL